MGLARSFIQLENTIHTTCSNLICCQENARYLSVKSFSTKVLIADKIFSSPTGDGTAILRGHPSDAKV